MSQDMARLTDHLATMVRAPRSALPRLDRLRVWRDIAAVRAGHASATMT